MLKIFLKQLKEEIMAKKKKLTEEEAIEALWREGILSWKLRGNQKEIYNHFKSTEDDIIEFSCISQLGRRFQDHILCVIGRIDKHFPYSDVMKIRKIPNVTEIKPCDEQTIVDHIGSCKKLFTFPAKLYIPVCIKYDIPYYEFPVGKNATNFHPDAAYRLQNKLKGDYNGYKRNEY